MNPKLIPKPKPLVYIGQTYIRTPGRSISCLTLLMPCGDIFLTDSEVLPQQLPHTHLVEPCFQLPGEEHPDGHPLLLQLALQLAPGLPQEPLQKVLHGPEHPGGVMPSQRAQGP